MVGSWRRMTWGSPVSHRKGRYVTMGHFAANPVLVGDQISGVHRGSSGTPSGEYSRPRPEPARRLLDAAEKSWWAARTTPTQPSRGWPGLAHGSGVVDGRGYRLLAVALSRIVPPQALGCGGRMGWREGALEGRAGWGRRGGGRSTYILQASIVVEERRGGYLEKSATTPTQPSIGGKFVELDWRAPQFSLDHDDTQQARGAVVVVEA